MNSLAERCWRDFTFATPDGLKLFARECGPMHPGPTPLLCLPGLTRNSKDFEPLANALNETRRIVALDYRGRGRSQNAADPSTYTPRHELADAVALLDRLQIGQVCVIGTSRGGIIAMLMAAMCGPRIAGAVLNDIGPRLEPQGLERIVSLISQPPSFASWSDAVAALRASNPGIVNLPEEGWNAFANRVFTEELGRIFPDYDPRIAHTFPTLEDIGNNRVAELWDFFEALKEKPCAVLRGENSDLLSEATTQRMAELHPRLIRVTVKDRAHVPFLDEPESIAAIRSVAAACD